MVDDEVLIFGHPLRSLPLQIGVLVEDDAVLEQSGDLLGAQAAFGQHLGAVLAQPRSRPADLVVHAAEPEPPVPTVRIGPMIGCSMSTTMSRARTCGSATVSS